MQQVAVSAINFYVVKAHADNATVTGEQKVHPSELPAKLNQETQWVNKQAGFRPLLGSGDLSALYHAPLLLIYQHSRAANDSRT